eukprot:823401-Rhodomonas_salina.2
MQTCPFVHSNIYEASAYWKKKPCSPRGMWCGRSIRATSSIVDASRMTRKDLRTSPSMSALTRSQILLSP